MINLFIIDDHKYLSKGIAAAFENQDYNIQVVGSATDCMSAVEQIKTNEIDIILLDIIMPEMDGITCCKHLKEHFPQIHIIAFTGELNPKVLIKVWLQKVDGIMLKTCGMDELASTIVSVMKGQKVIGDNVPGFFANCEPELDSGPKLTKTELVVLKLLGSGMSRKEAADEMNRSMYAIDFHCKNLFKKFNTNRIHAIIAEARKSRIIK